MENPIRGYGMYIKKISDLLGRDCNRSLQARNLTVSQSHMLMALARSQEDSLPLKELESRFQVAQSTMAGLVSRLEAKGLVECFADPADRRVKRVRLSPAGRSICEDARRDIISAEARLTQTLNPQERTQLLQLLQRVYESLKDSEQKG